MKKFLLHDRVWVRFLSLYGIGLAMFIAAWVLGFWLLPEGILTRGSLAGSTASDNLWREWIQIYTVNLAVTGLVLLANSCIRINGYPLGYQIPLIWLVMYGVTLGTNSFAMPMANPMAPSLAILGRSGLYELAAFTLLAAATHSLARFEIKRIFVTNPEKVLNRHPLIAEQYLAVGVSLFILLISNLKEAAMVVGL